MHIAYITADPGVPVFGQKGCSIHVQELLRALAKRGEQIDLFAVSAAGQPPPDLARIRLHRFPPPPKGDLSLREQKCLEINSPLRAALKNEGPFTLIYERYSLWSFAPMEYARATGTPGLLEVNAPLIEEQAEHRGLVDRTGARRVAERVFSAATALLAVSDEVAKYLQEFPATQGKVHVVPNGVNPDRFPADQKPTLPAAAGTFTIGFVGTMKPWHGLENLLKAFARYHERCHASRLLLVGDGIGREPLAAAASAQGLGNAVVFTGAVPAAQVPGLLASMDVAVAPYPNLPNFYFSPLKVYEYMAAGLPVVASRIGQIEKLIEHEITGMLVPPGDVPALASELERLGRDPTLRRRLGQAARARVVRNHTWDGTAERILGLAGNTEPLHLKPQPGRLGSRCANVRGAVSPGH
jgi:glycosyltransferase involved in cell wall biosynthesis